MMLWRILFPFRAETVGNGDQMIIERMERKPHHVVVIPPDRGYSDVADLLLYAVGTRLVERTVFFDVVVDFGV